MLKRLSPKVLIAFLVLIVVVSILSYLNYPKEDLQLVFFPLAVILFFFLPKNSSDRLPFGLILFCIGLWLASYIGLERFTEREQEKAHNYFARLEGDTSGLSARGFYQRFNEISQTYDLPLVQILHRSFLSDQNAREWLKPHKTASFVIRGLKQWLELVFSSSAKQLFEKHPRYAESQTISESDLKRMNEFNLNPGIESFPVFLEGFNHPFSIVFQPEVLSVPNEPSELSLHLIAWMGESLKVYNQENSPDWPEQLALRSYAAKEAATVKGRWNSAAPIGLALHMRGTLALMEMLETKTVDRKLCKKVVQLFFLAAGHAEKDTSPELFSSIFNNAGVSLLACAEKPEQIDKAISWLELSQGAASVVNSRASRASLLNLEALSD